MYQKRPGWRLADNWYVPSVRATLEFEHVCVDVNFWKSFVQERPAGAQAAPSRGRKRYTQADRC